MKRNSLCVVLLFLTPAILDPGLAQEHLPAIESARSGPWSDPGTWAGGKVPGDGQAVKILADHEVIFDADLEDMPTGLGPLEIAGTLRVDETKSTYLKMAGNISGPGSLLAGSKEKALPRDVQFVLKFVKAPESHYYVSNIGRFELYSYHPKDFIADLAEAAKQGDTVLKLDGPLDIRPGEQVHVITHHRNLERRTVKSYDTASGALELTEALEKAKDAGSRVVLLSRNIRLLGSGGAWLTGGGHDYYIRAEATGAGCVMWSGTPTHGSNHTFAGACYECNAVLGNGTGFTIAGTVTGCSTGCPGGGGEHVVTGHIIGCSRGFSGGVGTTLLGEIDRCNEAMRSVAGAIINGKVSNTPYGLILTSGKVLANARFENVWAGFVVGTPDVTGYGASFGGNPAELPSQASKPGTESVHIARHQRVFWDVNGEPGHLQGTSAAGDIRTDDTVRAPGSDQPAIRFDFVNGRMPVFMDFPLTLTAGMELVATVKMKKDTNGMTQTPAAQIIDPGKDPIYGDKPLAEAVMKDNDQWQTFELTYAAGALKRVNLRIVGRNTGGHLWSSVKLVVREVAR